VYGRTGSSQATTPFRGGTPLRTRTLVETAISAINEAAQRIFPPFNVLSRENYEHNLNLEFDGEPITLQHSGVAAEARMGFAPVGSNACGWIAAYNAFLAIGLNVRPAEIINFIENNNGLNAQGAFGTNPLVFDRLFREYGMATTTTIFEDAVHVISSTVDGFAPNVPVVTPAELESLPPALVPVATLWGVLFPVIKQSMEPIAQQAILGKLHSTTSVDLDGIARSGKVVILSYFHDTSDVRESAHYVAANWDEDAGEYVILNVNSRNPTVKAKSIYEFLGENRALISMTVIH